MSKHVSRSLIIRALIAGPRSRDPNTGILDRMDGPYLTDQDWERKTPIPDSGTAGVAICPTSRVATHFGHTSPAKISIFQGFEGLLLIGKSVIATPNFPETHIHQRL